jgi:opacity protein-like surface antigen
VGLAVLLRLTEPVTAAELPVAMPVKAPRISAEYGVYVGGYLGYAWGNSNWTTAPTSLAH